MIFQKRLSKITPELRGKIQNWIINHPNVIDSPDKNDIIKIGNQSLPKKVSCIKMYYIYLLMNYTKICSNHNLSCSYMKYNINITMQLLVK